MRTLTRKNVMWPSCSKDSKQCKTISLYVFIITHPAARNSRAMFSRLAAQVQAVPGQLCADGRETHPLPNAYPETKLPPQEALGKNA